MHELNIYYLTVHTRASISSWGMLSKSNKIRTGYHIEWEAYSTFSVSNPINIDLNNDYSLNPVKQINDVLVDKLIIVVSQN